MRSHYKCGGRGRQTRGGSGVCTYCQRVHPSKKKRAKMKWISCAEVSINRARQKD